MKTMKILKHIFGYLKGAYRYPLGIIICAIRGWPFRLLLCDIDLYSLPKSTKFTHPYAITIGTSVLGENCIIRQCVTIGRIKENDVVVLGNNVDIGCNTIILGDIKIGNNVKIGAGAIVLADIPSNKTVVGLWK